MTPPKQRRWSWYQQSVDAAAAILGIIIAMTMLVRDSWPVIGVVFALVCLGFVPSSSALRYLVGRWEKDTR